ncbi:unnamed protein product [Danaus chrysippus]|uniref:(African queen) hypothetical protein n=1 Tax=Danaus chrysippus TaxID=151541 RepID=A0A8J2R4Z8_9NEOP|nr:unnamed protein product [Danaus chrysippus]
MLQRRRSASVAPGQRALNDTVRVVFVCGSSAAGDGRWGRPPRRPPPHAAPGGDVTRGPPRMTSHGHGPPVTSPSS